MIRNVYFYGGAPRIQPPSETVIRTFAQEAEARGLDKATLVASPVADEAEQGHAALARQRALALKARLVAAGLPADRIDILVRDEPVRAPREESRWVEISPVFTKPSLFALKQVANRAVCAIWFREHCAVFSSGEKASPAVCRKVWLAMGHSDGGSVREPPFPH